MALSASTYGEVSLIFLSKNIAKSDIFWSKGAVIKNKTEGGGRDLKIRCKIM